MKKFTEFSKKPVRKLFEQEISLNQDNQNQNNDNQANNNQQQNQQVQDDQNNDNTNKETVVGESGSNVTQFFSKLFESREMAHIYHLQVNGEQGSYAKHEALGDYYEDILEIIDDTIEVYQGQYGLIDGYDVIDTNNTKSKEALAYFEELAEYVKNARKCISHEDTHLHSLIDDIVCLIYKTVYKLKFLK